MDAGDGVKRLVLQAVDRELLEAVVGPRLAPAWVKPLRAQYARFKQACPAGWVNVEKVWRDRPQPSRPRHQLPASARYARDYVKTTEHVQGVRNEVETATSQPAT